MAMHVSHPTWLACGLAASVSIKTAPVILPPFCPGRDELTHYTDVIMGTIASQMTSLTIVYSTVYSDADQRK